MIVWIWYQICKIKMEKYAIILIKSAVKTSNSKQNVKASKIAGTNKQVGLAVCSKCLLSLLWIAGSILSHGNLWQPLGEYPALVKLCKNSKYQTILYWLLIESFHLTFVFNELECLAFQGKKCPHLAGQPGNTKWLLEMDTVVL